MNKQISIRPDGYYQVQVDCGYDEFGKKRRKTIYAKDLKTLDEKVVDFKYKLKNGIITNKKPITFEQMANIWVEKHTVGLEETTLMRYKSVIKNQLSPLFPKKLNKISTGIIQELLNSLLKQGYTSNIKISKVVLFEIFKKAVAYGYITSNPVREVEMPKYEKGKGRALTREEIQAIKATTELTLKEKVYLYIGLYAGLRQGEILALSLNDINLVDNYISVTKTLTYPSNIPVLKNGTKTKKGVRIIRIGEPLISVLREYIDSIPDCEYLFQRKDGTLFTKTAKENLWKQIKKKINLHMPEGTKTNMTSHCLRHNYASDLCNLAYPVKQTQYLLGHANSQTTLDIYAEVREELIDISAAEEYWMSNAF